MSNSILIIEDNNSIRQSMAEILQLSGFKVLQAGNGKQGVDCAIQHKPDLIVCDIMMPDLDGYGVLYMLSKHPDTDTIPFIFLTARSDHNDFRRAMELGADDYLTKPFDGTKLLSAVEKRLNKRAKQMAYFTEGMQHTEHPADEHHSGSAELQALIDNSKIRQVKRKHLLYCEGDEPMGIYLIIDGHIKTFKIADDGRELMTGLYMANDFLAVSSLFSETAFRENAEAVEDTTFCMLSKEEVLGLINRYPDIGYRFLKLLSNNIKQKEEQLLELAYNSVRKRVAQAMLRLSDQSDDPSIIRISREQLASIVGIALETVSRTLTRFKDEGIIDKSNSHLKIIDRERLVKIKN